MWSRKPEPALPPAASLLAQAAPLPRRLWIAYSGGLDSHVLLHWLTHDPDLTRRCELRAAHVDHGLHPDSSRWASHCVAVCRGLGLSLQVLTVDARPRPGESPEAAARRVRYAALADLLTSADGVATAHHADDQAETVLLALLRGSGPRGLAAMPPVRTLGAGWLLRPLLDQPRARLRAYAERHGLGWIEDPANQVTDFDRNHLRHAVLPLLAERWPGLTRTLARSARHCAEAEALAGALAEVDLAASAGPDATLSLAALQALDAVRRRNLLRHWLRGRGLPLPSERQLDRVLDDVLNAGIDRQPQVRWPGAEIRRHRDRLYALAPLPPAPDPNRVLDWNPAQVLELPGGGRLQATTVSGRGL
ncbi:MAG: tRNA lysidine(34) synthetase TilS, partial [Candidatus Competibacterales bacterium]|nr:tRNA lysidine(34) synthetase TilS [Candidatus Competibacterales bacterium]